jgi:hypothetical protein
MSFIEILIVLAFLAIPVVFIAAVLVFVVKIALLAGFWLTVTPVVMKVADDGNKQLTKWATDRVLNENKQKNRSAGGK